MLVVVVSCAAAVDVAATILLSLLSAAALTIVGWQATKKRAAYGAINNQPLCKEEEDCTSQLTPAFLVLPKMKTRKKLGSLLPILHPLSVFIFSPAYFASSQFFHPLTNIIHNNIVR